LPTQKSMPLYLIWKPTVYASNDCNVKVSIPTVLLADETQSSGFTVKKGYMNSSWTNLDFKRLVNTVCIIMPFDSY
jgi:hypothetical protein